MRKIILPVIFLLISILVTILLFLPAEAYLEVSFLAVGQGDSILVESPFGQNILIDGGPGNSVVHELGKTLPFYDRTIDLMILTHPHDDHVAGLIEVLNRYNVKKILCTGVVHTSPAYIEWLRILEEKEVPMEIVSQKQKISLGKDCYLEILWPRQSLQGVSVDNLNNTSIVAKLVYGQNKFLFTGDIEKEAEESILMTQSDLKTNVLKVAHHGSDTSTTDGFLQAVSPEMAVIAFGQDNKFGFPIDSVIKKLKAKEMTIFNTLKTVELIGDGVSIRQK